MVKNHLAETGHLVTGDTIMIGLGGYYYMDSGTLCKTFDSKNRLC